PCRGIGQRFQIQDGSRVEVIGRGHADGSNAKTIEPKTPAGISHPALKREINLRGQVRNSAARGAPGGTQTPPPQIGILGAENLRARSAPGRRLADVAPPREANARPPRGHHTWLMPTPKPTSLQRGQDRAPRLL